MARFATVLFSIFLAAATAHAQITTSRINVHITGANCGKLENVFLVINDRDMEDRWIRLDRAATCRWTADLGEDNSVSTAHAHFSLRLDFARTDCRQAAANEEQLAAELEFACCNSGPLRTVQVKTEPPMPVSYVRNVSKDRAARVRGIACIEGGAFPAGSGVIRHAQFSGEDVYLQLGSATPQRRMLGVHLDEIVVDDGAVELTRDGVAYRLLVQRAKGKGKSAPTLSPNAISLDIKRLTELKLERARIEVIQ